MEQKENVYSVNWVSVLAKDDYEYKNVVCAINKVSKILYSSLKFVPLDEVFEQIQSEVCRRRTHYIFFQPSWARALKKAMNSVAWRHRKSMDRRYMCRTEWAIHYRETAIEAISILAIQCR